MKNVLVLIFIIAFQFGCKKKPEGTPIPKQATLELIKTQYLGSGTGGQYYVDARATLTINGKNITPGEVRINDTIVDKQPDYNFALNNLHVAGTDWAGYVDGNNTWTFSGSPEFGIPAFAQASPIGFSSLYLTNTESVNTINRSAPFTIEWDNSVPCDSIEVLIHDRVNNSNLSSGFFKGTTSSYTFTVSQLAMLHPFEIVNGGTSDYSFINVNGIIYRKVQKDDLKLEARNISSFSKSVNIR